MVIKQLQHWLVARAHAARWKPISDWARERGGQLRQTADGEGMLLEIKRDDGATVRIEWGKAQRTYIDGFELRMRCEARLHPDLQLMVLDLELMEQLEKAVFEAYTDTLRTRADTDTPEEMRWLVMFPKYTQSSSKLVRQQFGILGVTRELAAAWVEGRLSEALAQSSQDLLPVGRPFVLMTLRGNVYLRTALTEPTLAEVQTLCRLLEIAVESAQRVSAALGDHSPWPTTSSVAFQGGPPDEDLER